MFFNFKNKNMLIILLLLVVLASVFCYSFMMKDVEGNTNLGDIFLIILNCKIRSCQQIQNITELILIVEIMK